MEKWYIVEYGGIFNHHYSPVFKYDLTFTQVSDRTWYSKQKNKQTTHAYETCLLCYIFIRKKRRDGVEHTVTEWNTL